MIAADDALAGALRPARVMVALDADTVRRVDAMARIHGLSRSVMVERMVSYRLLQLEGMMVGLPFVGVEGGDGPWLG